MVRVEVLFRPGDGSGPLIAAVDVETDRCERAVTHALAMFAADDRVRGDLDGEMKWQTLVLPPEAAGGGAAPIYLEQIVDAATRPLDWTPFAGRGELDSPNDWPEP